MPTSRIHSLLPPSSHHGPRTTSLRRSNPSGRHLRLHRRPSRRTLRSLVRLAGQLLHHTRRPHAPDGEESRSPTHLPPELLGDGRDQGCEEGSAAGYGGDKVRILLLPCAELWRSSTDTRVSTAPQTASVSAIGSATSMISCAIRLGPPGAGQPIRPHRRTLCIATWYPATNPSSKFALARRFSIGSRGGRPEEMSGWR